VERREAGRQLERHIGVAAAEREVEGSVQVGAPVDERFSGRLGALGADTRRRVRGQVRQPGGMPPRGGGRRRLVESRPSVGAQGLQHPEAARRLAFGLDHRVLRERDEQLEHPLLGQPVPRRDPLGVLEIEGPLEHGQPPEQLLLGRCQQRVAGLDRGIQRAAAEHGQTLVEAIGDR
jgi:hypothetical protein